MAIGEDKAQTFLRSGGSDGTGDAVMSFAPAAHVDIIGSVKLAKARAADMKRTKREAAEAARKAEPPQPKPEKFTGRLALNGPVIVEGWFLAHADRFEFSDATLTIRTPNGAIIIGPTNDDAVSATIPAAIVNRVTIE